MTRSADGVSAQSRRNAVLQYLKLFRDEDSAKTIIEVMDYVNHKYSWHFERKTYHRDLMEGHVDGITATEKRPARFYISKDSNVEFKLSVKDSDVQLLAIALSLLKGTAPLTTGPVVGDCETNLISRLPIELAKEFERFNGQLMVQYGPAGKSKAKVPAALREVLCAFRQGVTLSVVYNSPHDKGPEFKKSEVRELGPLRLEVTDSALSILAQDLSDPKKRIKRFIISRMRSVTVSNNPFKQPHPREYKAWENSFGNIGGDKDQPVPILVEGDEHFGLFFCEREIHPSQKVTKLSETRFRVEFEMPIGGSLFRILSGFSGNLYAVNPSPLKKNLVSAWNKGVNNLTAKA